MKELFRSNDPVMISYAEAVLKAEGVEPLVLDQHMSVLEGSGCSAAADDGRGRGSGVRPPVASGDAEIL